MTDINYIFSLNPDRFLIILAKFYEASADYLPGMTKNRQLDNTALSGLHLIDAALTLLKERRKG